uniref:Uncharacterized protein n=1 Tax=Meloidogyne floridensis TaxID=298350 RepID=A0A915PAH7_9BILA
MTKYRKTLGIDIVFLRVSLDKCSVSTSHTDQERCKCGAFLLEQLDNYLELNAVDGSVMELKYTTESLGLIGEGQANNASYLNNKNNFCVYHAHWIGENTTCVALKVYYSLDGYRNELDVLEYLNRIDACSQIESIRPSMQEIAEFLNGDIDQLECERNADFGHHQHYNIEYFHQYDPHQYEIPHAEHGHPEHHGGPSNAHGEIKRSPRH